MDQLYSRHLQNGEHTEPSLSKPKTQCVTRSPTLYHASTHGRTSSTAPMLQSSSQRPRARHQSPPSLRSLRRRRITGRSTAKHPEIRTGGATRHPEGHAATSRASPSRTHFHRASKGTRRRRPRARCCPSVPFRDALLSCATGAGTAAGVARGGTSRDGAAAS